MLTLTFMQCRKIGESRNGRIAVRIQLGVTNVVQSETNRNSHSGTGIQLRAHPDSGFSQTPYYQGKTITILRGGEPGGSGDMPRAPHPLLEKYISGNPTIVIENMPGAAGMKAVNHAYSTAKPDGLTITAVGSGLASGAILGLPGVRYDIDKLIYVGSTEHGDPYVLSRKDAGFDTLEKLRAASGVRVGAQTVGHAVYISGRIFAYLLGLKDPRIVVGFGGVKWMPP